MKPDENLKVALYQNLVKSRELEEQLTKLPGFHAGVGEEAVVVGSFFGLAEDEYCAPHYRGALMAAHMRGADLHRLIAGVLGKATSYNRGRVRGDPLLGEVAHRTAELLVLVGQLEGHGTTVDGKVNDR